jgi:hypothetical protein
VKDLGIAEVVQWYLIRFDLLDVICIALCAAVAQEAGREHKVRILERALLAFSRERKLLRNRQWLSAEVAPLLALDNEALLML